MWKKIEQYIYIFAFIAAHGALFYAKGVMTYIPQILIILISLIGLKFKIEKRYFTFFIVLVSSITLTAILCHGGIGPKLIFDLASCYLITLCAIKSNNRMFLARLVNLIVFFALISLLGFAIWTIAPSIITRWFHYESNIYGGYYNGIIYVVKLLENRNVGMFYEPGVYGTVLLMTLFYMIFFQDCLKFSRKKMCVSISIIVSAIITTMSVMTYIGLAVIVIFALLPSRLYMSSKIKKLIIIFSIVITVGLIRDNIVHSPNSIWETYVIDKVEGINNSENTVDHVTSGGARFRTAEISWELFLKYPLGCGYDIFSQYEHSLYDVSVTGGNILFKHLATAGIVNYGLTLYMVFGHYLVKRERRISKIAFIVLFINITIAQSQMWYPLFFVAKYLEDIHEKENILQKYSGVYDRKINS